MKTNIIMSSRGQITLPSEIRKKYGMDEGSVLVAEDRNGEIILKPAAVYEVDYYTDAQIKEWAAEDAYKNNKEREETRAKLKKLAAKTK
jgi:AbrB family looped-hinge helix DNA binding protein